jgi:hypothetical protein
MWMVTLGRARAAISGRAKISAGLQCALGQVAAGTASALGKLAHICRDAMLSKNTGERSTGADLPAQYISQRQGFWGGPRRFTTNE